MKCVKYALSFFVAKALKKGRPINLLQLNPAATTSQKTVFDITNKGVMKDGHSEKLFYKPNKQILKKQNF